MRTLLNLTLSILLTTLCPTLALSQSIRGTVTNAASGEVVPYAVVRLDNTNTGSVTDEEGHFSIDKVELGRHTVEVSSVGFEPMIVKEILVNAAKDVNLDIRLSESVVSMSDVVVRPRINKETTLNTMVTAGGRMFSVEEAARYAGGFDDPARLATSFAGVSTAGATNGISIHGNAPYLLLWRLEDIEIPNPNHFADISALGGGIFSSLSSQVIGNSDFLTCAFPAEYGNAVSGVFDMKMRTGNNQRHEHTFQIGVAGIDLASEGPIGQGSGASYIVNYRYSMTGIVSALNLIDMGGMSLNYQDLNFKVNLPTKKAGTFSLWGTGLIDKYEQEAVTDTSEIKYAGEDYGSGDKQYMFAAGLSHKLQLGKGYLHSTVATTYFDEFAWSAKMPEDIREAEMTHDYTNLIFKTIYNRQFSPRFTAQLGAQYTHMFYTMRQVAAEHLGDPMELFGEGDGNSGVVMLHGSGSYKIGNDVTCNFGVNYQHLGLNSKNSVEPRLGLTWRTSAKTSLSTAYGLHSRVEKLDVYFVKKDNEYVNRDLSFTKAHHAMVAFNWKPTENVSVKVEPYYQRLFDVPVEDTSSYSILNRLNVFIEMDLESKGEAENYGVDVTAEKYLSNGWYGMLNTSIFKSRYKAGNGNWYNTMFDRRYIVNVLFGKEWHIRRNMLCANIKCTWQGGDRHYPVDYEATVHDPIDNPEQVVEYDETQPFTCKFSPMFIMHYTISYKINKERVTHEFAIKHINATSTMSYYGHQYNKRTGEIESAGFNLSLPNISYRIEF